MQTVHCNQQEHHGSFSPSSNLLLTIFPEKSVTTHDFASPPPREISDLALLPAARILTTLSVREPVSSDQRSGTSTDRCPSWGCCWFSALLGLLRVSPGSGCC